MSELHDYIDEGERMSSSVTLVSGSFVPCSSSASIAGRKLFGVERRGRRSMPIRSPAGGLAGR
jgi:hypothetical protein